jgi:integrase
MPRQKINIGKFSTDGETGHNINAILTRLENWLRFQKRASEININAVMGSAKYLLTHYTIKTYDEATAYDIEKDMTAKGLKPKTITNRLLVFQYLAEIHGIKLKLKKPKKIRTQKEYLTVIEARALLDAANNIRDRAIVAMFLYTGLRVTSLSSLKVSDIDLFHRTVIVKTGTKNYQEYKVILSNECLKMLKQWLDIRPPTGSSEVFLNQYGEKLAVKRIEAIVKDSACRAGIDKRVYPHMLRTTCATNMLKSGVPITEVSLQLGHKNLASTMIYLAGSIDDLKESIDKKFVY